MTYPMPDHEPDRDDAPPAADHADTPSDPDPAETVPPEEDEAAKLGDFA